MGICKPCFIAYFSSEQVRDILSQNNEDYTETVVYQLTEGCVSFLGYDMYVKSTPTDSEWIAYDVLTQPVNIDAPDMEQEMRRVLADYLKESGLSCRENKFEDVTEKESNGYE